MDPLEDSDVVITGVSGVFPKADNLEDFADKLFSKENLLSNVPYMPCKLGKLNDLSKFDAEFFGFQPHRVEVMDPMARMILEKAYEAIIDSGNNPTTFKGKNCGVFVGIHFLETEVLVYEKIQKGASLAISRSFNANRISYWLGVHGPSFTVDSACSSTLLALEMAYKAIRSGECDSALVGGCHVCLHPALLLHLLKVGALNPNGESRVFDENAGGFCKAEAIGVFYLQKAKDAKRVYAKVINVRSNHDGTKKLFLSPHGPSQAKLLEMIYKQSNIDIDSVSWIEAHATGTLVGDKQEVTAIDQVFKNRQQPLLIGSVKSNMGHAEAAAAVGSISKVLIAMETGFIPPNINISSVRKDIEAFSSGRMKVVTEKTPWKGGIVGVSGFGMGGANTHAILESFTKEKNDGGIPNDNLPRIIGVSGRTEDSVKVFLDYLEKSSIDAEFVALLHEIHSFEIPLHPYRGYVIVTKDGSYFKKRIENVKVSTRPLWYCFSNIENNINSIYEAFNHLEIFKEAVLKSDELLRSFGLKVIDALENSSSGDVTLPVGLSTVIIQIALNSLMTSLNLAPDNVIGESYGGLVKVFIDGILTLDQSLKIAYYCSLSDGHDIRKDLTSILHKMNLSDNVTSESQKFKDEQDSNLVDYLTKLLFNPNYIEDTITSVPKNAIILDFSSSKKFVENLDKKIIGESIIIPMTKNDCCSFNNFITSLGELYLLNVNPHFQKLYPAVKFPVSKSTKMIAPLIKWKHDVQWPVAFSSFQERMLSGERKVSISLDDKDDAFLAGHEIDSSVFYPASGFIVLVWETLALIHGKAYTDLSIVFENLKFHDAVILRKNQITMLSIMVQKGNRNFEILHNGRVVVTGQVYVPSNVSKETLAIVKPPNSGIVLDGMDFYRLALIKNFNYKGAFRNIKQINSEGTRSIVSWNNNWITYLDGILHLRIISSNFLEVPVEVEKIVIDVNKHKQLTINTNEVEVFLDKNLNVLQSGGVQTKGNGFRCIPGKLTSKVPLVQKYKFVPFESNEKKLSMKNAITLFGQCVMDSMGQLAKNVKIAEILDDDFDANCSPIASYFASFMKEQPLFQAKLLMFVNNNTKNVKIGGVCDIIEGKLPLSEKVHVLICSHALKNPKKLEFITNSLIDNGFIITREDSASTLSANDFKLQVCGSVVCNDEFLVLLRKNINLNLNSIKIIKVSSVSFDWIEEVQTALKTELYERIILVSENESFSGILGFYNCLRLERGTENVRCLCILDKAEPFSIHDEFFQTQLLKDLAINVYKNEKWGCYVKLPIDELVPKKVRHAVALRKINGLKSCLKWYKGDIEDSDIEHKNIVQVYYASINSSDVLMIKNRLAIASVVRDPLKQDYALGIEFSGIDKNEKRCLGLRSYGCLSTMIEISKDDFFLHEVPKNWSLEDATTVPLAYYTVVYALVLCCKLKHKNSILIHSAGSIVSQAAIHIAIYYGCNIFVTISSVDEKLFIKENFPYIPDSKIGYVDISFEQMIHEQTDGKGVDIILNSLTGEKLSPSINCLAPRGRLVQVKKTDFNINFNLNKLFAKNVSVYSATVENIFNLPKHEKIELRDSVEEHIRNGAIKPLARTSYFYTAIESAVEYASSTKNFGKCVIQIEPEEGQTKTGIKLKNALPRVICDPKKTYIVCGGLGGMGMELVKWLIIRGARKIVVTSRKGVTYGSQTLRIEKWKSLGVQFIVSKADISNEEQTMKLLEEADAMGSVAGIFNLAAVLKDKMFKNQTVDNFRVCAGPKIVGTYNLDKCSRLKCPSLDYFVIFSSISSGHGNLGQTNYGLCNSAAERICEQRNVDGLPALAIEWGGVGNVGMLVNFLDGNSDSAFGGNYMQPMQSCLEVLDYCMNQASPVVVSCVVADK